MTKWFLMLGLALGSISGAGWGAAARAAETAQAAEASGHAVAPAARLGDPQAGAQYYAVCKTCHGDQGEGNPKQNAPRIAGQQQDYLLRQVTHFRAGVRGAHPGDAFGAQMRAMSMTLPSDQAVRDVVAYVSTFPDHATKASLHGDLERGREIFRQCAACHGAQGLGNAAFGAPRIAGQWDWYLLRQLQNLRVGVRGHHPDDHYGLQMSSVVSGLLQEDEDMRAVIAYLESLP